MCVETRKTNRDWAQNWRWPSWKIAPLDFLLISFLATKRALPITLSVHAYVRPPNAYYLPGHFDCINIGIRLHPYLGNIILLMNANIINAMQCSNFGCILADDYAGKGWDCLAGKNAMILEHWRCNFPTC